MASEAAMTVDFLRARLLSERSVSRASKERADQLAAKVAELEEQVRAVTAQRQQAERETDEVLAILESRGFSGSQLSDVLDSGSDNDAGEEQELRDAKTNGDAASSHGEVGREQEPAAQGETEQDEQQPGPGGLSWKGRSVSPRKARQLKQRHRRSYLYLLALEPDPSRKYRMGQSCRKNKRTELRSPAPVEEVGTGGIVVSPESRKGQQQNDERDGLDGEVGGHERSSGDGRGQYVIKCQKDGEMERVLEKQAELIGQFEAEEKAQRDWEKQFNDNRRSTKGDVKVAAYRLDSGRGQSNRSSKVADQEASSQVQANSSGKLLPCSKQPENSSEEHSRARIVASISARGSSNNSTATRRNQDQQGDANSDACSSYSINAPPSRHRAIVKSSSESTDTRISKVSDWSSSRFHDHSHTDDRQLIDTRLDRQPSNNDIDVESVLQALQRAKISLTKQLSKPLPPSQVTLALPAPGDEYRTEEEFYDGNDSYRGEEEHSGSSPSRQEILALPAPEDYRYHEAEFSSFAEKSSGSSPPRQEILALPAPGDDCPGEREDDSDLKIPISNPGLFRLPTDSFPPDEMLSTSNGHDPAVLGLGEAARHAAVSSNPSSVRSEDPGVSAKQCHDLHGSGTLSLPDSRRCNAPSSVFSVGSAASFLSGVPELPEDLRRGRKPLADVNSFMQRGCDYTVSNNWML